MFFKSTEKLSMPSADQCLPGREKSMPVPERHEVLGTPLQVNDATKERIVVGMGCFWGAERLYWKIPGVYSTAVGYAGGVTKNPTYEEVCSGRTGHTEVVNVVFDPKSVSLAELLVRFWEEHDPTQGFRQGNDLGTQYRSALYFTSPAQGEICLRSQQQFQSALKQAGKNAITTELKPLEVFYFAEPYHQQYLAKNPNGYCGLAGTGVKCS